jgi:hypothetical protein
MYLSTVIGLVSWSLFLIAFPLLTVALMRRAGIRGAKLALAAIPPAIMFTSGITLQTLILLGATTDFIVQMSVVKSICDSIGTLSPLIILAMLRWPILDRGDSRVETFQ